MSSTRQKAGAAILRRRGRPTKQEQKTAKGCAAQPLRKGTSEHWERRLRRDAPALAARVDAGELTPHQAAEQKGWRKPRKKPTPFEQVVKLLPKLSADEKRQLLEILS